MNQDKDTLFSDPLRSPAPFRFDQTVVDVFPDMIKRSVPGYETVVAMSGLLAARFARTDTVLYDLGCSLGATLFSLRQRVAEIDCQIVGIDNSTAMINRCRELLSNSGNGVPVELIEGRIQDVSYRECSMVTLNYTLQFVPIADRTALLTRLYDKLIDGGVLVLSEKIAFEDAQLEELNVALHHDFKRAHGYSDLEIAGKRDSLENVLVPETLQTHRERLEEAGFSSCDVWFQCFNFASLIAIK
ncbi:MAG: carboxy-S-adenosyl-L-methionine synthase CmoA [Pseudomonadota bacterium]